MEHLKRFVALSNFYEEMLRVMAMIRVQKGGIAEENYVGRQFAADVLEVLVRLGDEVVKIPNVDASAVELGFKSSVAKSVEKYKKDFSDIEKYKTVSQKPIQEMTVGEFAKAFNVEVV